MTDKPKTRAQLEADFEELAKQHGILRGEVARCANELALSQSRERQTRSEFDDLKERLANAEPDNQRMRGYIARVQEDDVVREELVVTGEPGGEQQLAPKRKPVRFEGPSPYRCLTDGAGAMSVSYSPERPKLKHWVTY